jgi:predicted dehydrogenase
MKMNRRDILRNLTATSALHLLTNHSCGSDQSKKKIKIGQIGVSHAHANKIAAYRNSPDYELVGVVEPDEKLRSIAEKTAPFQGVKWLTRQQLFETPDLQAVLIETQVRDLLENAEICIDAGKHIHIDKPAGESLLHLKKILEKAANKQLLVQMGYMFRYNPAVVLLREFLRKGWLGEIFEVHAVMSKVVEPPTRKQLAQYPGGIMFELGCHVLDLVIGVLGKPDQVTSITKHSSALDDQLLDNMLAVLNYPRAIATIKSSAIEVEGFDRRHLVVCGTLGTFHIQPLDDPAARISLSRARDNYRKGTQNLTFPKYTRYLDDAADMAKIIRGEKKTDFSYEHDLIVQETLLKACGL